MNKSEKIRSNFLVQLAGQISENNIQEFLKGSQFPKFRNRIQIPEIFLTFFVGRIKPWFCHSDLDPLITKLYLIVEDEEFSGQVSSEEVERLRDNMKNLDGHLGSYPYGDWKKWVSLTNKISADTIAR